MPKRKREAYDNKTDHTSQIRKQDVHEKYSQSKKLLYRALKTAKGFERQKLGKRLKLATSSNQPLESARINREIGALKGMELSKTTEGHLHRSLLKVKTLRESELLPDEVRRVLPKPEGTEEMATALHNVTSGMYNAKQVKEVMERVLSGMCIAIGMPAPANKVKGGKKELVKGIIMDSSSKNSIRDEGLDEVMEATSDGPKREEPIWEGFDSANQGTEDETGSEGDEDTKYQSLDEEDMSRYEALPSRLSDEESFDEEHHHKTRPLTMNTRQQSLSLSLSPPRTFDQSNSESDSDSDSAVLSPPPTKSPKTTKSKQTQPPKPSRSTFLPTLMGGYLSGSESASDIEDSNAPIRKNRPGQMARRAIWEKKYGTGAVHIKTGKGSVAEKRGKDDGWDAQRGAKDDGRGRGKGDKGRQRNFSQVTGENAIDVQPRKRVLGKKDDVGVLHPSWQAAKKAKEMKKTARFEGKKVTFD